ncbi:ABC transporter permease [Bacillus sp. UMB0899]|uniref:ABC transporter permease n=1 Tax=Metabacillus schmidteae TaxID=2730405 RepID=UPI000C7FC9B1|nr:ABC transporter permease [Metabacillus schmidteae]PMC35927.1 ABC transporter permease [Bacillus sp. UMB0899]
MLSFIKKDLLIFWRDRKEIITVLVLPIILVLVLNFAFAGLFGFNDDAKMDLQLAVVNQDNDTETMTQLKERLLKEASLNEEQTMEIMGQVTLIKPISMLEDYLQSDDLKEWVTVYEMKETEAVAKVKEGELDGILIIPDGFTADSLYSAIMEEPPTTLLKYKVEMETNDTNAISQIIQGFMDQMNYQFALQKMGGASQEEVILPEGGIEKIGAGESFTLTQYFPIAIGALFSLFLASTVATKTGEEIRQRVFHRILLTNSHPFHFLIGKVVSTFCLAWLQTMFVFISSHFILDVFPGRTISFWLGTIGIVTLLSLAISGLSAVFTSISLRVPDIDAANGIFMIVIILFGIIGGSFVPVYLLPDWLQQIGEWTPNGLSLAIMTQWVQFEEFSTIIIPCMILVVFFIVMTVIGLVLYPKKGEA